MCGPEGKYDATPMLEGQRRAVLYPAGLGDVAVPGLLACLALRYDASRATDMRARASAAAAAICDSLAGLQAWALKLAALRELFDTLGSHCRALYHICLTEIQAHQLNAVGVMCTSCVKNSSSCQQLSLSPCYPWLHNTFQSDDQEQYFGQT